MLVWLRSASIVDSEYAADRLSSARPTTALPNGMHGATHAGVPAQPWRFMHMIEKRQSQCTDWSALDLETFPFTPAQHLDPGISTLGAGLSLVGKLI